MEISFKGIIIYSSRKDNIFIEKQFEKLISELSKEHINCVLDFEIVKEK